MKLKITSLLLIATSLAVGCSESSREVENTEDVRELASADTAVMYGDTKSAVSADGVEVIEVNEGFWTNINFESPVVNEPRLKGSGVEVRSNETEGYEIYSLDEKVLFNLDKATLREGADEKLRNIAETIKEKGDRGPIRIFGHTDSQGSKSYNKQLGEERAMAVKNWLQNNTEIDPSRLSVQSMGQTAPRATNETAEGRQKNRRVAIVVVTRENG